MRLNRTFGRLAAAFGPHRDLYSKEGQEVVAKRFADRAIFDQISRR